VRKGWYNSCSSCVVAEAKPALERATQAQLSLPNWQQFQGERQQRKLSLSLSQNQHQSAVLKLYRMLYCKHQMQAHAILLLIQMPLTAKQKAMLTY